MIFHAGEGRELRGLLGSTGWAPTCMWGSHAHSDDPRACPISSKEQEAFRAQCSARNWGGTRVAKDPPHYTANHDPPQAL